MAGISHLPKSSQMGYPKTMATATECIETVEHYYQRSLSWAHFDLKRCVGSCSNIIELFVHAKVGVQYVKRLEPFAQRLMETATA
jgi:hypothetical protein